MMESKHIMRQLVRWRRSLHQYPEIGYEERKTARFVITELQRLGIPYEYGGVGGGIVARSRWRHRRPTSRSANRRTTGRTPC